jgi:FlaG/FlaF family flagellin (archaellin)
MKLVAILVVLAAVVVASANGQVSISTIYISDPF